MIIKTFEEFLLESKNDTSVISDILTSMNKNTGEFVSLLGKISNIFKKQLNQNILLKDIVTNGKNIEIVYNANNGNDFEILFNSKTPGRNLKQPHVLSINRNIKLETLFDEKDIIYTYSNKKNIKTITLNLPFGKFVSTSSNPFSPISFVSLQNENEDALIYGGKDENDSIIEGGNYKYVKDDKDWFGNKIQIYSKTHVSRDVLRREVLQKELEIIEKVIKKYNLEEFKESLSLNSVLMEIFKKFGGKKEGVSSTTDSHYGTLKNGLRISVRDHEVFVPRSLPDIGIFFNFMRGVSISIRTFDTSREVSYDDREWAFSGDKIDSFSLDETPNMELLMNRIYKGIQKAIKSLK